MTRISSRLSSILALLILLAGTGWIYLPPYSSTFLLDDYKHFEFVRGLLPNVDQWWVVFRPDWSGWHYRPLHHLLIMAGMTAFATDPLPYYLSLLVLHGLVIACLIILSFRLGYRSWAAFATGVIFAIAAPHWQVVGWISSLTILTAALFSLMAIIALVDALHQQDRSQVFWRLGLAFVCFLIALSSREETLLLFPLMLWLIFTHPRNRWRKQGSIIGFAGLLLTISIIYIYINLTRSTWAFNADAKLSSIFSGLFSLDDVVAYLEQLLFGYWAIEVPLSQFDATTKLLVLMTSSLLVAVLYQRLPWGGKLGLLWGIAGVAFIYVLTEGRGIGSAQPIPQRAHMVPSDRYLYLPWIGISLALGASLNQLVSQTKVKPRWFMAAALSLLLVNAVYQTYVVRQRQALWLPEAATTQSIEQQLKELLPEPPKNAHFYAMRAADIPDYFQAMASTWYSQNFIWPGGAVSRLLTKGWGSPDDYVFDFDAGVLYDLMPELRTSNKTWLLLQLTPQARLLNDEIGAEHDAAEFTWNPLSVVGPTDERRLGIQFDLEPQIQDWHSLCYTLVIPSQAVFQTAIYIAAKDQDAKTDVAHARVRLLAPDRAATTLWNDRVPVGAVSWFPIDVDLRSAAGENSELCVEVSRVTGRSQVEVAWANPRITIASDDD